MSPSRLSDSPYCSDMLKDKSARNLQAGEILAAAGLVDPAASRFYYAMFQAAVHRLTALGWTPGRFGSGAIEWSHTTVYHNILLVRSRRSDSDLFRDMRWMRQQADYSEDSIAQEELSRRMASVRDFVEEATR